MCDVVEVLWLGELERQVLADRQGLLAAGVREGLPWFPKERAAFYARLSAAPRPVDQRAQERAELDRALGKVA